MIIEGKNSVYEALESGTTINKIYALSNLSDGMSNKIIRLAKNKGLRVDFVSKNILDKLSQNGKHQGFIADIVDFTYSTVEDILNLAQEKNEPNFILILDGIEDPHNFGAIIRSAECAGVHGIIIGKHRACQVNDTVVRISSGAICNMKIAKVTNLNQTIQSLKDNGVWVYGLELGGKEIERVSLKGNVALVVGSEGRGITEQVQKNCDEIVSLEMHGKVNSLNASVATGIGLYEILRQRKN